MKRSNSTRFSKSVALLLIALMVTIIPNMKVYSAVGNYSQSSSAITANDAYVSVANDQTEQASIHLAVALMVSEAVVYVAMVHHIATGTSEKKLLMASADYKPVDFAAFDN